MPDPVASICNALEAAATGVVVVYYPDPGLRDWLVAEVESIAAPGADPLHVSTPDEAREHPQRLVILLPVDEAAAVRDLDGLRDTLLEPPRLFPVVLFLLRGGSGHGALVHAPGLASWIRGNDPDPEALAVIDVAEERRRFVSETGEEPEAWLGRWRNGEVPSSAQTFARAYRAMLVAGR